MQSILNRINRIKLILLMHSFLLQLLSWFYGVLARGHQLWFLSCFVNSKQRRNQHKNQNKNKQLACPVLVVGNVVAGGGGKTPAVLSIALHLQRNNQAFGVVSRGYGRKNPNVQILQPESQPHEVGDEPAWLRKQLQPEVPIAVGVNRLAAAHTILENNPNTQWIVSDDGLQHHRLPATIAVLVMNDVGLGNGKLLPAGPLRQHLKHARFDVILHTGAHPKWLSFQQTPVPQFRSTRKLSDFGLDALGNHVDIFHLGHQKVNQKNTLPHLINPNRFIAVAGIAQPQGFFDMLREKGLQLSVESTLSLPDHVDFSKSKKFDEWLQFQHQSTQHHKPRVRLLCTEKDAIKLWKSHPHLQAIAIPLVFEPEVDFFVLLDSLMEAAHAAFFDEC